MISKKITEWKLIYGELDPLPCHTPCTMYSVLLDHGIIEDPYYRLNEKKATVLSEKNCEFISRFNVTEEMLCKKHLELCFDGLDTICDVYINGTHLLFADNMHRTWRKNIKDLAHIGENDLKIHFHSPSSYIKEKQREYPLYNSVAGGMVMEGIGHIRKSFCMFGWDWGPMLPDMGIYRDVYLNAYDAKIDDISIRQSHENGKALLIVSSEIANSNANHSVRITLTEPDGKQSLYSAFANKETVIEVKNPLLWWPNGLGSQPLYTLTAELLENGAVIDVQKKTVGLRTLSISRNKDEYGEEFCFTVNGKKFFAMGADYIPEDAIIAKRSDLRTKKLIEACAEANFNSLRVWGGGFYPDDEFYELCDKYGIVVWQDFMVACANVRLTEDFTENIIKEAEEILHRIRHHACLGVFCGNNEMELALVEWSSCKSRSNPQAYEDYLRLYEDILPEICAEHAPDIFYWRASPSSHGSFNDPNNENIGDTHYWAVWHGGVFFEEYRKHFFRFCSEFGFEAFPDMKTLRSFAEPEDMELLSDVMLSHQKCLSGNQKILDYIKAYYKVPYDFGKFVYLSQLLQADAIRYGAEHFRRFRGRCMGALYWQLNDCWPTVSWSSVDYFGRWKALHYKAKKFFAPILISVHEDGSTRIVNVSNETLCNANIMVTLNVRDNSMKILASQMQITEVGALSANDITISPELSDAIDEAPYERYLEYILEKDGEMITRDSKRYVRPAEYRFTNPYLHAEIRKAKNDAYFLDVTSESYAGSVMVSFDGGDIFPEDNFFDITDGKVSIALRGSASEIEKSKISIISLYDVT